MEITWETEQKTSGSSSCELHRAVTVLSERQKYIGVGFLPVLKAGIGWSEKLSVPQEGEELFCCNASIMEQTSKEVFIHDAILGMI